MFRLRGALAMPNHDDHEWHDFLAIICCHPIVVSSARGCLTGKMFHRPRNYRCLGVRAGITFMARHSSPRPHLNVHSYDGLSFNRKMKRVGGTV
jgi:hypothetical protein